MKFILSLLLFAVSAPGQIANAHYIWGRPITQGVPTNGYVLVWSDSAAKFVFSVPGNLPTSINTKAASFSFSTTDSVILCDATSGTVTGTLPTAIGIAGRIYYFKKIDAGANNCIAATTGGQTIDGASTNSTNTQYSSKTMVSNGANWFIL